MARSLRRAWGCAKPRSEDRHTCIGERLTRSEDRHTSHCRATHPHQPGTKPLPIPPDVDQEPPQAGAPCATDGPGTGENGMESGFSRERRGRDELESAASRPRRGARRSARRGPKTGRSILRTSEVSSAFCVLHICSRATTGPSMNAGR